MGADNSPYFSFLYLSSYTAKFYAIKEFQILLSTFFWPFLSPSSLLTIPFFHLFFLQIISKKTKYNPQDCLLPSIPHNGTPHNAHNGIYIQQETEALPPTPFFLFGHRYFFKEFLLIRLSNAF